MIKFIIRCIKQALFGRYTIETSCYSTPDRKHYALFHGLECLETSDDVNYLKKYLKDYIKRKKVCHNKDTIRYFDTNGNEL